MQSSQTRRSHPSQLRQLLASYFLVLSVGKEERAPKTAIVLPVLVKIPHAVTFCFVRVFWMEETRVPAAPVIIVDRMDAVMASLGWYTASSGAMMKLSVKVMELYDTTAQAMCIGQLQRKHARLLA